ncbi:hypothetical protein [Streptomyces sp. NBC_00212]|uniref:hypothetical protein n=1 Tax=Streptomyces sp. NBC_00212 TaxID=2975684 RepID=UPI00324BDB79
MSLAWPGFELKWGFEGLLEFIWADSGVFEAKVERCVAATLYPPGQEGGCQLVLRFRFGTDHGPAPVVVRLDVPPEEGLGAKAFMSVLWNRHGIPDRPPEDTSAADFERVPNDAGWILSPAGPGSEELFQAVMAHVNAHDA